MHPERMNNFNQLTSHTVSNTVIPIAENNTPGLTYAIDRNGTQIWYMNGKQLTLPNTAELREAAVVNQTEYPHVYRATDCTDNMLFPSFFELDFTQTCCEQHGVRRFTDISLDHFYHHIFMGDVSLGYVDM